MCRFLPRLCARRSHARAQERMCAQMDEKKQREAAALPNREGCFVCGGVIVFSGASVPCLGSLGQRELAAVRLTEGWIRSFLHCGRYLHPLRHGAERRAASPYTGEASPNGDIFSLRPQYRVALPSPQRDGLKSPQQISRKRKTPLPERTNRQGRFHRRNGVGKRNYHVAWGRDCVPCQRAERFVCGHENSRLLSDSAHYIMPLWISKANISDS